MKLKDKGNLATDGRKSRVPDFEKKITNENYKYTNRKLGRMQINVGKLCNLQCVHCHVGGGPKRTEIMTREVMEECLKVFKKKNFEIIDITGGAPEMNPNFEWLLKEARKLTNNVIVRTNLVILKDKKYEHLIKLYKELKVKLVCSLPCYTAENTDEQRGFKVFEKNIEVLKELNRLGYGKRKELELEMVYNPGGPFLPPPQKELEKVYKQELSKSFGVEFNNLIAITNNPIGRFGESLIAEGLIDSYYDTLYKSYNRETIPAMMCRDQISVGWDGRVYDCDFNQAIGLEIATRENIRDFLKKESLQRKIRFGNHCYACTAGQGSSCSGAIERKEAM